MLLLLPLLRCCFGDWNVTLFLSMKLFSRRVFLVHILAGLLDLFYLGIPTDWRFVFRGGLCACAVCCSFPRSGSQIPLAQMGKAWRRMSPADRTSARFSGRCRCRSLTISERNFLALSKVVSPPPCVMPRPIRGCYGRDTCRTRGYSEAMSCRILLSSLGV